MQEGINVVWIFDVSAFEDEVLQLREPQASREGRITPNVKSGDAGQEMERVGGSDVLIPVNCEADPQVHQGCECAESPFKERKISTADMPAQIC
jgi:hypothetical protein